MILNKLSSSHCLPNFCQKFTRRFPVFTKSGVNFVQHCAHHGHVWAAPYKILPVPTGIGTSTYTYSCTRFLPLRAAARCTHERGGTGAAESQPDPAGAEHDSTTCSEIPVGAGKMRKHATRATVQRVDSTRSTTAVVAGIHSSRILAGKRQSTPNHETSASTSTVNLF